MELHPYDWFINNLCVVLKSSICTIYKAKMNAWEGGSFMESHSYFYRVPFVYMDVVINVCFNLLIDN
jgi:hypothetical protein